MHKIGFYCSSLSWGGLEINFTLYALELIKRGYCIKIYCVKNSPIANKLIENKTAVTFINRNKKYFDFINAYRVYKLFKKDGINLLWIRAPRDIIIAGLVKTFAGNKIKIIYQQGMQISMKKKDIFHTIRFSKIDAWITPLNYLANQIKELTRFDPEKIHIIPLAVNNNSDKPKHTSFKSKELLNIPQDKFVLGILGRIDPLKSQLFLIKALEDIRRKNPNIILLIVGDASKEHNEYMKLLKKTAEFLNLSDSVFFRPFNEDVDVFYKSIDLFTLASKNETFGMVTIEAMTNNVPIIATNSSGTPEILENGNLGFLYEPGDINDFCNKANWIINNYDKAKELSLTARNAAINKYNEFKIYSEIERLLTKL